MSASGDAPIVGVRRIGEGPVRFRRALVPGLAPGDWVADPGPAGEEPAQVVVAADRLEIVGAPPPADAAVTRRLTAEEVARLPALADRAREALQAALALAAGRRDLQVVAVRFALDGVSATLAYRAPAGADPSGLVGPLAARLGVRLVPEREGDIDEPRRAFGGLGRIPARPLALDEIVRERFSPPGPETPAPEGLPRLGARVATPAGEGTVVRVDTRHREATVRLDSGEEVALPLAEFHPGR